MKKLCLALLIVGGTCGWPKKCSAQSTAAPLVSVQPQQKISLDLPLLDQPLDVSNIVNNLHPAYLTALNRKAAGFKGAFLPAFQFHTSAGLDLIDLNAGLVWENVSGIGGPMGLLGFRFDNIAARAYTNSWLAQHTSSIKIPSVEGGPWGGYINRIGWVYGVFVSTKL